jgi:DNA-binding transcriptional LysR family regulator
MIDNSLDLNLMRLYVTMVESPSLTAAAASSGMTRSNTSRRLKILEKAVGAQLMRRTTRHAELTEAGQLLYAHALKMLEELRAATASIDSLGKTVRGDVRVRLPTGLAHLYLTPVLLDFARKHPEISLRVVINDSIGDLISAEVDVALKVTSQPPEDHVARRICDVSWCLCAAATYLDARAPIIDMADLEGCDLITPQSLGRRFNLKLTIAGTPQTIRVSPRIQSGDYPFLFESMMAGLGVALLPRYAVWRQIETGTVREVLENCDAEGVGDSIYMITTSTRFPTVATRTLMDFIGGHLESQAPNWRKQSSQDRSKAGGP